MRKRYGALVIIALVGVAALILASCGGLPPINVVVVVTATPDPNTIVITVTPAPPTNPPPATNTTTPEPATAAPTLPPPPAATNTVEPPTPTLSAFPTETRAQIYIAHQDFQNGYMIWISTTTPKVVWVLIKSPDNPNQGEWRIYQDTYADGEPEVDANLTPPSADMYQPRRGFGKLWRETPGLRDALGWATTPEFALNTPYVYQPGGTVDAAGQYIPGPGKHFITTLGRQTFALIESPTGFGRWERVG